MTSQDPLTQHLVRRYVQDKVSIRALAKEVGVSRETVRTRLHGAGVAVRKRGRAPVRASSL
ncbi:helix-turn-helix domain-containing protein [Plantactinospora sp. CA-290183]|uniref:helix-turn-helix domain-containing protein n=1 Tax=Plantactinospora sp. CA-290183 TaxID=3240006 RepID=UPI003D8D8778